MKNMNNYFFECFCQFDADACSFKEYNTGKNIPGQVVVPTDEGGGVTIKNRGNYNTAYIEINTSTDRYGNIITQVGEYWYNYQP